MAYSDSEKHFCASIDTFQLKKAACVKTSFSGSEKHFCAHIHILSYTGQIVYANSLISLWKHFLV